MRCCVCISSHVRVAAVHDTRMHPAALCGPVSCGRTTLWSRAHLYKNFTQSRSDGGMSAWCDANLCRAASQDCVVTLGRDGVSFRMEDPSKGLQSKLQLSSEA